MASLLLSVLATVNVIYAAFPCSTADECSKIGLYHIPGPNPIVAPKGNGEWESTECEVAGGVFKVDGTYYFIYHCLGSGGYEIGISTATKPLGPWTPPPNSPNLAVGKRGEWDQDDVASFNILADPRKGNEGKFIGYYEGGMGPGTGGKWTMGMATSNGESPLGPWSKYTNNPILKGESSCIDLNNRSFNGVCNGLYVGSALFGEHTNNEYWIYMEAPINENDEGPFQLWINDNIDSPQGPFTLKAFVLDGGQTKGQWDSGRYSESRFNYFNGLFHAFPTASAVGNPRPNKINEQIGWVMSDDGINFIENLYNPIARYNESTPHTQAMAEGHFYAENDGSDLIYVYHTIRWDDGKDNFAPNQRNAEDLGVEIFAINENFVILDMPLITENWKLNIGAGQESPCLYNWADYRYCVIIKSIIKNTMPTKPSIQPKLSFNLFVKECRAGNTVNASINIYQYDTKTDQKGARLKQFDVNGNCGNNGFNATTQSMSFDTEWVVSTVRNYQTNSLDQVTLSVNYNK